MSFHWVANRWILTVSKSRFWNVLLRSLSLSASLTSSSLLSDPAAESWLTKYIPSNSHPSNDPGSCRRWGVNEVYTVQWVGLRSAPVSFCARLSRCLLPPPDLSEDLVPPRGLMVKEMTPTFGPRYAFGPGNTLAGLSYLQSHFRGCGEKKMLLTNCWRHWNKWWLTVWGGTRQLLTW